MGENFDVTWGGFANNFRESFFKKFGAELDFSDVTLACEGGQVEAHRVVPAAGSPHLHALLKRNPDHRFIYLRGVALPDHARLDLLLLATEFISLRASHSCTFQ